MQFNEIITEYVTETIREKERDRATRNYNYSNVGKELNSDSYDQMLLNIEEYIAYLKERLAYGEHVDEMKSEADKAVDQHNLRLLDDDDYQFLCLKVHQAATKAQEVVLIHWQSEGTYNQEADIQKALSELGIPAYAALSDFCGGILQLVRPTGEPSVMVASRYCSFLELGLSWRYICRP